MAGQKINIISTYLNGRKIVWIAWKRARVNCRNKTLAQIDTFFHRQFCIIAIMQKLIRSIVAKPTLVFDRHLSRGMCRYLYFFLLTNLHLWMLQKWYVYLTPRNRWVYANQFLNFIRIEAITFVIFFLLVFQLKLNLNMRNKCNSQVY